MRVAPEGGAETARIGAAPSVSRKGLAHVFCKTITCLKSKNCDNPEAEGAQQASQTRAATGYIQGEERTLYIPRESCCEESCLSCKKHDKLFHTRRAKHWISIALSANTFTYWMLWFGVFFCPKAAWRTPYNLLFLNVTLVINLLPFLFPTIRVERRWYYKLCGTHLEFFVRWCVLE